MFQKKTSYAIAALLFCGLLAGCSQWRWQLGSPLAEIQLPVPTHTVSLAQALNLYGPPQRMSASDSGYVLAWEYWEIKEDSLGFSLGVMGADLLSANWGEMRAKGEFVLLTFDRQHMLSSAAYSRWDNYGGGGKAIQPFASFVSVVDADDLLGYMSQHRWGGASLRALPRALNNNSNSDTGQNGLEQRGTPIAVGQQTLEMH